MDDKILAIIFQNELDYFQVEIVDRAILGDVVRGYYYYIWRLLNYAIIDQIRKTEFARALDLDL